MGVYAARRDWLRDNREMAVGLLRALLMAYDVLQRDYMVGIHVLAETIGIKETWAETIYQNAPSPKIHEWANFRYHYSLVKNSVLHRRLGHLATFLLDEKLITKPVTYVANVYKYYIAYRLIMEASKFALSDLLGFVVNMSSSFALALHLLYGLFSFRPSARRLAQMLMLVFKP